MINFANPAGLVTQALIDRSPVPIVGVWDSPQVIARHIGQAAELSAGEFDWRYTGLNHLGCVTAARRAHPP